MWMGGGRAGFIGSKFNGDLVPIPIQCAPFQASRVSLWWWENVLEILSTIRDRGKEKSRERRGWGSANLPGCKIEIGIDLRVVLSTRGSLSIFTSRCINVSGRNYTPVEGGPFINTLGNYYWPPPAFAPSQGNARVINFVINHRELRVFVHVLLHVDALDVFVPCYLLFEWRESVIESVNFTAISDSQYRRSHLPSLPFVRLSPLRFFDVCFKYGRTYVIVERIVVMERGIESRLKFYFRLRIIALRNCWMSIEFLNGIPSTCSYIYYVHRWMSLKTTSFKF